MVIEDKENLNDLTDATKPNNNLINCNACGALVSKKSSNCPKCGNPIKKSKKWLGCAIGCLTPILIIVLLIAGFIIRGNVKDYRETKRYETVVNYVKENGTLVDGSYIVSANVNELLNLSGDTYKNYTIWACVDKNDSLYFTEFITREDRGENAILVRCNREKPHKCAANIVDVNTECEISSYYNSTYSFLVTLESGKAGVVKENHPDMIFFSTALEHAEKLVDSFNLGLTLPELYTDSFN